METAAIIIRDGFWSGIAAAGFAVLFNVPPRLLWGCVLAGACGHALRTALIVCMGLSIEPATLFAAVSVGVIAQIVARKTRAPSLTFAISGSIPMVPGLFAYSAMIGIIQATVGNPSDAADMLVEAAILFIRVALILSALATGIVLPSLIFRRERPVV